jgi:phosphoglycolate phosphatase
MKKIDSIIFDLDGTLWDASETSATGWNVVLVKNNLSEFEVTADDIRKVSGLPFDECLANIFGYVEQVDCISLEPIIDEEEKRSLELNGGTLFEGVVEGIRALSKDFPLFLVSNCQSWYLRSFWNQFKVEQYFQGQDCYGDSGESKAEMIKGISNKHFLKHPIYIGDTEGDQKASHEAGVVFGYASYGFGEASNPQVSFSSFDKLVSWFLT